MILLLQLLAAHIIGDFVLQPTHWVNDKFAKKHKSIYLYAHVALHMLLAWICTGLYVDQLWIIGMVGLSHGIIDVLKLHLTNEKNEKWLFFVDQGLHLATILALTIPISSHPQWILTFWKPGYWVFIVGLLSSTFLSGMVIRILLGGWKIEELEKDESLPNAGYYIGLLERLFVFLFIVGHQWTAIGFLVTAKSVFRFNDLTKAKDRKLTEYMLIGNLLSFGMAMLVGFLYHYVSAKLYKF